MTTKYVREFQHSKVKDRIIILEQLVSYLREQVVQLEEAMRLN